MFFCYVQWFYVHKISWIGLRNCSRRPQVSLTSTPQLTPRTVTRTQSGTSQAKNLEYDISADENQHSIFFTALLVKSGTTFGVYVNVLVHQTIRPQGHVHNCCSFQRHVLAPKGFLDIDYARNSDQNQMHLFIADLFSARTTAYILVG